MTAASMSLRNWSWACMPKLVQVFINSSGWSPAPRWERIWAAVAWGQPLALVATALASLLLAEGALLPAYATFVVGALALALAPGVLGAIGTYLNWEMVERAGRFRARGGDGRRIPAVAARRHARGSRGWLGGARRRGRRWAW